MTEDHKKKLDILEVRVHDLMGLCDKQKEKINELIDLLDNKSKELQQALDTIATLNIKYDNLLTAQVISVTEEESRNAKMRVSKLVREVNKCIALLNQ